MCDGAPSAELYFAMSSFANFKWYSKVILLLYQISAMLWALSSMQANEKDVNQPANLHLCY